MQKAIRFIGLWANFKDTRGCQHFLRVRMSPDHWRTVEAHCLAPYLDAGDAILLDFERQPEDGDLVLVAMRYRRTGIIGAGSIRTAEAVKLIRLVDGEPRLFVANGESVHADAHEVLGTVVGWYRPGWWRRPSPRRMRLQISNPRESCEHGAARSS